MEKILRVLIIEDSEDDTLLILDELRAGDYDPVYRRIETAEELAGALAAEPWDLILSDYRLPRFNAPTALEIVKQHGVDVPFIILSGAVDEETAVAALKAGAHDFFRKEKLARLLPAVERELAERHNRGERKRAIQALQSSEERFRSLAQSATDGISCTDARGSIVFWNAGATRLFGYAEEQGLGMALTCLLSESSSHARPQASGDAPLRKLSDLLQGMVELRGTHKEGHGFPVELSLSTWSVGGERFYTGILRDITKRKQSEDTIRLAQEELERTVAQRTRELAAANASLQERLEELERFEEVVVGRELKMIALEKELERIRGPQK